MLIFLGITLQKNKALRGSSSGYRPIPTAAHYKSILFHYILYLLGLYLFTIAEDKGTFALIIHRYLRDEPQKL